MSDMSDAKPAKIDTSELANGIAEAPPGARDVPFAALYCLHVLAVVGLAVWGVLQIGPAATDHAARVASGLVNTTGGCWQIGQSSYNYMTNNTGATPAPPTPAPTPFPTFAPVSTTTMTPSPTGASTVQANNPFADASTLMLKLGALVVIAVIIGALMSSAWIQLAKRYPKQLIIGTIVAVLAINIIVSLVLFLATGAIQMLFMLVFCLFGVLLYFLWRKRIPFAAAVLGTVGKVIKMYNAMLWIPYVGMLLALIWFIVWGTHTVANIVVMAVNGDQSCAKTEADLHMNYNAFIVWTAFSNFWTTQVIANLCHVTIAGVFATWYFTAEGAMPSNPTAKAWKRATTTSFGSICLGSLLVAILQTIRFILRSMRSRRSILACIIDCILKMIENLLKYFNKYAFTQVAIYGRSYCEAAKATMQLIKSHGIEAIVNDMLIAPVLSVGAFLGGLLTGAFTALISIAFFQPLTSTVNVVFVVVAGLVALVIGYIMMTMSMRVIDSGVATIFVAFAMDPAALERKDPELYATFVGTYNLSF